MILNSTSTASSTAGAIFAGRDRSALIYAGFTLALYDYLLMLDKEVKLIWRKKFSLGSWVYVVTRYAGMASFIFLAIEVEKERLDQCQNYVARVDDYLWYITNVAAGVFQAVRTHAISGRRRSFGIFLTIYTVAMIGLTLWTAVSESCDVSPQETTFKASIYCGITFTVIVFAATLLATCNTLLVQVQGLWPGSLLITILIRNGFFYFLLILVQGILRLTIRPLHVTVTITIDYISNPLIVVLTTRFILDLRHAAAHPNRSTTSNALAGFALSNISLASAHQRAGSGVVQEYGGDHASGRPAARCTPNASTTGNALARVGVSTLGLSFASALQRAGHGLVREYEGELDDPLAGPLDSSEQGPEDTGMTEP